MDNRFRRVGFVGAGRTGTAIALGLGRAGYRVTAVASRSYDSAVALASKLDGCEAYRDASKATEQCDVAFLTVPDDAISSVASSLPWREDQGVVHCSGALSSEALDAARKGGALPGCLHPLQTFASRDQDGERLRGVTFGIEGDERLCEWLAQIARRLGGVPVRIPPGVRPLYHASAVMACGYITTLLYSAAGLWEPIGRSSQEGVEALLPLVEGTIENVKEQGLLDGATGPIIRGDAGTVGRHLEELSAATPKLLALYCRLGLSMIALAEERGSIDAGQGRELRATIRAYLTAGENGAEDSAMKGARET